MTYPGAFLGRHQGIWTPPATSGGSGPTVFVQDSFTAPDGTSLLVHVGEVGATWAKNTASGPVSAAINNDRVNQDASGGTGFFYASGVAPSADYTVTVGLTLLTSLAGAAQGVIARASTTALSGYVFRYTVTGTAWQLVRWVAGAPTIIGTPFVQSLTIGQTYQMKLQCAGSQISGWVDGVQVIPPVTDSTLTTAGVVCLYCAGTGGATTGVVSSNITATG